MYKRIAVQRLARSGAPWTIILVGLSGLSGLVETTRMAAGQTDPQNTPVEAEFYYFHDESVPDDAQTIRVLKSVEESGFRLRRISARRFPRLAERFRIARLPSLLLLRRNRLADREDRLFTFGRIREMLARARQRRADRRERIYEILAGRSRPVQSAPTSIPPEAPRYVRTAGISPIGTAVTESAAGIPSPLDRNGRFPVAHQVSPAEARAYGATVRLRVIDPSGTSHGTGTIIHSSGLDALVLTCGHIFRESRGRGRIEADVLFTSGKQTVGGQLISYDANAHDVALLTIRTPVEVQPAIVARPDYREQTNRAVFTIGCDKGSRPTIRRSHFKRAAIYDGTEKYDVFGRPIDGRSGGGLFNERGELIGVCNAAAVHVDEGIYSGLKTIYHQLQKSHLSHLFTPTYYAGGNDAALRASADNSTARNGKPQFAVRADAVAQAGTQTDLQNFESLPQETGPAWSSTTGSIQRPDRRGSVGGDAPNMASSNMDSQKMVPVVSRAGAETSLVRSDAKPKIGRLPNNLLQQITNRP